MDILSRYRIVCRTSPWAMRWAPRWNFLCPVRSYPLMIRLAAEHGPGYVVDSLEAALWAFYQARDFREGALLAVNLGGDADTTGAVYGQLAGAFYGEKNIPAAWRDTIAQRELISELAEKLFTQGAA